MTILIVSILKNECHQSRIDMCVHNVYRLLTQLGRVSCTAHVTHSAANWLNIDCILHFFPLLLSYIRYLFLHRHIHFSVCIYLSRTVSNEQQISEIQFRCGKCRVDALCMCCWWVWNEIGRCSSLRGLCATRHNVCGQWVEAECDNRSNYVYQSQ